MNTVMMPAGTYYVGDLCYVIADWSPVVDALFPSSSGNMIEGKHTLPDNTEIVLYSTSYGDGEYFDGDGRAYGVDAGVIGCILQSAITKNDGSSDGGQMITFDNPFECSSDGHVLNFGHISIDTAGTPDYDEKDDYDYDEDR